VIHSHDLAPLILYRLDMSYFGAAYHGFQSQPSGKTIQDHLEAALATFCRHPIRVTASSRTDTGVHAEHQVVTFKAAAGMNLYRMVKALNALLPSDIRIASASCPHPDFHPILHCSGKVYRYRIWRRAGESPFITPLAWSMTADLDLDAMRAASHYLIGLHDFSSFCAIDSSARSKVRRIREIMIRETGPLLEIWVLGDGFLKQMVRNIVGTLIAVGKGAMPASHIPHIIAARNRREAGITAPGSGLCLVRVFYGDDSPIGALLEQARNGYTVAMSGEWT
jgi:tRNA pseudouridine38-40 synthase